MLRYAHIAGKEKDFLAMTGYTTHEFTELLPQFQTCYDEHMTQYTIEGYERTGYVPATYHNSPLPTIEDKLLFILVFLKQNPTQTLQGYLFGISQTNANKWIHLLHTVLNRALAAHQCLPQRDMQIDTMPDHGEEVSHPAQAKTVSPSETPITDIGDQQHPPFLSMMAPNVP